MQVFYTSPWVPPEFILAHGLEPRGIWSVAECAQPQPTAGSCAYAQTIVGLAETRGDAAFVFTTHCDQLRRGFDTLSGTAASQGFLFNLPATWQTPAAERLMVAELRRLGSFLLQLGGRAPSPQELAKAISHYDQGRQRLLAAAPELSARQFYAAVSRFHWDGSVSWDEALAPESNSIPLALVGGPLPHWQSHMLEAIVAAGGRIVLNATEAGERVLGGKAAPDPALATDGTLPDLVESLARSCLDRCVDVYQRPNTRLYLWLKDRIIARRPRGILLWHFVGCDLWRAEAQSLRDYFDLPVLLLEAVDSVADTPRQTGRIQAFLESLR